MTTVRDAAYWDDRYVRDDAPWDLHAAAPELVAWLEAHPGDGLRAIVPGCGLGYDPLAAARAGYRVTAVDFSGPAVEATRALASREGVALDVLQADLFSLSPQAQGTFDLWLEHTCFCAIDPAARPRYVEVAASLVKPGGTLFAVFFTHGEEGGPPFDVRPDAIGPLFAPHFRLTSLAPATRSVADRRGEETIGTFVRS